MARRPSPPSDGDWRAAYHEQIHDAVDQYREWRRQGAWGLVDVGRRRVRICDLTDGEIEVVARREAEVDVNYAINQSLENDRNLRARFGEAL